MNINNLTSQDLYFGPLHLLPNAVNYFVDDTLGDVAVAVRRLQLCKSHSAVSRCCPVRVERHGLNPGRHPMHALRDQRDRRNAFN
jgi:hypothetical protein